MNVKDVVVLCCSNSGKDGRKAQRLRQQDNTSGTSCELFTLLTRMFKLNSMSWSQSEAVIMSECVVSHRDVIFGVTANS